MKHDIVLLYIVWRGESIDGTNASGNESLPAVSKPFVVF